MTARTRSRLGTNFVRGRHDDRAGSRLTSGGSEQRKLIPNPIRSRRSKKMKRFNLRLWLRDRAADVAIDESLLQQSPTARASNRLIQASMIFHVLIPVLVILLTIHLTPFPALTKVPAARTFA